MHLILEVQCSCVSSVHICVEKSWWERSAPHSVFTAALLVVRTSAPAPRRLSKLFYPLLQSAPIINKSNQHSERPFNLHHASNPYKSQAHSSLIAPHQTFQQLPESSIKAERVGDSNAGPITSHMYQKCNMHSYVFLLHRRLYRELQQSARAVHFILVSVSQWFR
jgi:hypothetical protein